MTTTIQQPVVRVESTRFGLLEVEESLVLTLPDGMIGFESCRRYVVFEPNTDNPIKWFQCLDNGAVAFPILDPWRFKPDYAPAISDADALALGLYDETPKLVFVVVTIPRDDPQAMTANLLGPIVLNALTRRGKQAVVLDERYGTKHRIMDEITHAAARQAA